MQLIVSKPLKPGSNRYRHGQEGTTLYNAWSNMRSRCNNPKHRDYHRYGGRGITICARWDDYVLFAVDMGPHPGEGWSLDRRNNSGNYTKRNCRWATKTTQGRNTRKIKLSLAKAAAIRREYKRGVIRQKDIAFKFGVNQTLVSAVIRGAIWR